ncbi:MAG: hypothetical protein FJZ16_08335 [Candidatus Omnitrophica bacterium]|nr:hypothetical protein [Candidatus Omnitrophota bacterium]MBM4137010.1 hypothetical protein [Nitrospira sp.]
MKVPIYKKTEDIWTYQLEPANPIIGSILLVFFILFFVLHAIQNNMDLDQDHYLFFMLIVVFISLLITKKKVLEINRRDKIINKWSGVLFFKKNTIQPITDFNAIKISTKTVPIEEGYLSIVYSLIFLGPRASIEILSFNDEKEAEKHLSELSRFLNLRAENTPAYLS